MSFADKELLQVRKCFVFLSFGQIPECSESHGLHQVLLFEQLLWQNGILLKCSGGRWFNLPACSSWIWKSLWTLTPTFGWSAGCAGTSQSAGGTLKASLNSTTSLWSRPLKCTSSRPWGWLILSCREVRLSWNNKRSNYSTHCWYSENRPTSSCHSFWGGGNMVAIDLIVQHVHSQLEEVSSSDYLRGWRHHESERENNTNMPQAHIISLTS